MLAIVKSMRLIGTNKPWPGHGMIVITGSTVDETKLVKALIRCNRATTVKAKTLRRRRHLKHRFGANSNSVTGVVRAHPHDELRVGLGTRDRARQAGHGSACGVREYKFELNS
jgi:hypothetical protein